MKNVKWFLPVIVACFSLFTFTSCQDNFDFEPDDQDQFVDNSDDGLGDDNSDNGENGHEGVSLDTDSGIALYRVDGQNIIKTDSKNVNPAWMNDEVKHNDIWKMVTTLIPADKRRWMTTFEIFDGGQELLGYVYNATQDLTSWNFALGIDSAYPDGQTLETSGDFIHTIIHEYGHIMSLNDEQLNPNLTSCDYNPGEGCARSDSYLNGFYSRFWADIANEHSSIGEDDYNALDDFYNKYEDRFVSDYAATNPVEDLAEVFSHFITGNSQPTGNQIKDEKIRYLYEFPELVSLRNHMKESAFTMPEPGEWKRPSCKKHRHTATQM
jgi:hypothetical protein